MGFLDSISSSINRGTAGAHRVADTARLRGQANDLMKKRQNLAAQLGASLYEATRSDPAFRTGREALYDGLAEIDAQRAAVAAQIKQIEAEASAEQAAAVIYRCPQCGGAVRATDLFCMGCGKPIAEVIASQAQAQPQEQPQTADALTAEDASSEAVRTCPNCGAPIGDDFEFCMSCGSKIGLADDQDPQVPDSDAQETEDGNESDEAEQRDGANEDDEGRGEPNF